MEFDPQSASKPLGVLAVHDIDAPAFTVNYCKELKDYQLSTGIEMRLEDASKPPAFAARVWSESPLEPPVPLTKPDNFRIQWGRRWLQLLQAQARMTLRTARHIKPSRE
jgi:hypothetical protein